jgi:sigma-B regulation protein RsbU (phosphoserine phosphatase)
MKRAYFWLAILFAFAITSQATYTIDAIRELAGDYPLLPFSLGNEQPVIADLTRPAFDAGLRRGDRVVAIEGRPLRAARDLLQPIREKSPGQTLAVTVERDGQPAGFHVVLEPLRAWLFAAVSLLFMPWLCILLGFWVAALRPRDLRAWLVLGILLGMSELQRQGILDPRGWPTPVAVVSLAYRELVLGAWGVCMMLFGIYFPVRWRLDARVPWVKWILLLPLAATALWNTITNSVSAIDAAAADALPAIFPPWLEQALMFALTSLFFTGIAVKYRDPQLAADDRRRLRLLYWGCTVGMAPSFLLFLYSWLVLHQQPRDSAALVYTMMAMVLFPITMAYVIVVQRALDVRMVIRQGVQYALARGGIRVIQVGLGMAVWFAAVTLLDAPHVGRPAKLALIAIGIVVVIRIRDVGDRVRRWVDRRFFREAYDAERILGELSEQVRGILDKDELFETVARKLGESLHVQCVAVLMLDGGVYRPALATGYAAPLDVTFPESTETVKRMRRSREPVAVDGNLDGNGRGEEGASLRRLRAQMLLPLSSKKELLGFISLGPKKSEAPYSPSDTNLLRTVAAQTGLALENSRLSEAIASEVAQRELLHREIEIAREVQQRLFPQHAPVVAALEYAGYCRPARGVGGDYYDFLALSNGRLGLAVGDVSGKGVPAALLMASLQASVRGQSQAAAGDVAGLMVNVNRLVYDTSPDNRYATFFYCQFDPATRRLVYTNGGHNPPLLLRGAEVIRLETGGPVVGLFPVSAYQQDEVQLLPGDLLLFFTDGISEAENPAEEEWGEEALIGAARGCARVAPETWLPPSEMISRIMQAADNFTAGAPQHDDMTLVVARVVE